MIKRDWCHQVSGQHYCLQLIEDWLGWWILLRVDEGGKSPGHKILKVFRRRKAGLREIKKIGNRKRKSGYDLVG